MSITAELVPNVLRRLAPILAAIGVALVAFAWLNHINPAFPLWDDGVRDQLLARDCADLGQCHLIGARSSVAEFQQGAVWLDLLIAVRLLGGDTASARTVVLTLVALSIATLFLVVGRWLRAGLALPAAVLLTGALSLDTYPSQLINPSATAFPNVLTAAGLLCYGLSGQRRFLLLSAFALGVGINTHVGSLSLAPALLAVAALGRPRPWRELLAATAVLVATCFITSRAALLANLIGLTRQGRLVPVLAGGLIVVLLSMGLGSRFRRLSWDTRGWLVGLLLVLPFGLASLWLVFWHKHHFSITYLHPILAPTAALIAGIVWLPFEIGAKRLGVLRWIPTVVALAAVTFVAFHLDRVASPPVLSEPWTVAEASAITDQAVGRGWSYEDVLFRLQGNACWALLAGMSIEAPPPRPGPSRGRRQLQVVKVRRDAVPALVNPHDIVPLEWKKVAIVREIESWLQPETLVACRRPIDSGLPPMCSAPNRRAPDALTREHFLFATRAYPRIHSLDLPPPYVASYEIPLAPVAGESRDLIVTDSAAPDCGWRITRADGVQVEGQLPARHVRLHSDSGNPGLLVIEKPFGTPACAVDDPDHHYPPCVFETQPGDPLRTIVEAG